MTEAKKQQNIPSGWQEKKLADVCDIVNGSTPSTSNNTYWNGEINWYTPNDLKHQRIVLYGSERKISNLGLQSIGSKVVPAHSIILSTRAPIGYLGIAETKTSFNQGCKGLTPKDEKLSEKFLYYNLFHQKKALNGLGSGSTFLELSSNNLASFEVLVPPIKEQQKIADILGTVDENISKTQEVIDVTEKLKRGLMQQLFTRGIGHTKFKENEFGEIPSEWKVKELKDVSTKIGDGLHGTPEYSDDSEFYFINGNNISKRRIEIYPETKKISVEEHRFHKKELTDRSILLSINGTIGNIGFYNGEKVALGKSVAYINCDGEINKEFIAYQLETERIYKHFTKELTGTTIKNLSLGTIRRTPIFVPEVAEQKEIAEILSAVDEKISVNKTLKEKLTLLKKGLMQDLLSGNRRV